MKTAGILLMFSLLACLTFGQTSSAGPLGVPVSPPKRPRVPPDIRSAIPAKSAVRLIQAIKLTDAGERVVIYDAGSQYEPHAHIAVIRNQASVADFSLVSLFAKQGVGDTYAFFQAAQISLAPDRNGFMAAFRNIGDGAGTLYVLIIGKSGRYMVAWHKGASEAQFRVLRGSKFQLWDADEGDDCVWCPHHYEVTGYIWKDETLMKASHFTTERQLSPSQFSEQPIRISH